MEVCPMINVYTDGSCLLETGQGGWAYILDYKGYRKIGANHESNTTNNRMELTAVLEALYAIKDTSIPVTIYTDSKYVILAYSNRLKWSANHYRSANGKPLANQDLLKFLFQRAKDFTSLRFEWVKAHNGDQWNEYADEIASYAANHVP